MGTRKNTPDDFWRKVDRSGPVLVHVERLGPCWLWTAARDGRGYGFISYQGRQYRAHRLSWILTHGALTVDAPCVLHLCDNTSCVNPAHLRAGTQRENCHDRDRKGRQVTRLGELPPEKRQRGEMHWSRRMPERVPRGERSGLRLHPERAARGERCGTAKATDAAVRIIRQRAIAGEPQILIARDLGFSESMVSRIVRRQTWDHVV